jgi:curved DNA-binding protein CbpA
MTAAYNILSDPAARAKYDREIHSSGFGRYNEY